MQDDFQCNILSDNSEDDIILKNKQTNQFTMEIEQQMEFAQVIQNAQILYDDFEVDIIQQNDRITIPIQNIKHNYINNQSKSQNQNQAYNFRQTIQQEQKISYIINHQLEQKDEFSNFNIMSSLESKKFSQQKIKENNQQEQQCNNNVNIQQVEQIDSDNTDELDNQDIQQNKLVEINVKMQDQKQIDNIINNSEKQAQLLNNKINRNQNQIKQNQNEDWDLLQIANNDQQDSDQQEYILCKRNDYGIQNIFELNKQQQCKKELHKSDLKRIQLQNNLNKFNQKQKNDVILESTQMKLQVYNNLIKDDPKELQQKQDVNSRKKEIKSTKNCLNSMNISLELQSLDQLLQNNKDSKKRTKNGYYHQKNLQNDIMKCKKHEKQDDRYMKNNKSFKQSGKDQFNNLKQSNHMTNTELLQQQQQGIIAVQQQVPYNLTQREKDRKYFEAQLQILDNPLVQQQGEKETDELLNEDRHKFREIKIEKKKTSESQRLSKFKQMLDNNTGESYQNGKSIFEFNRLLKYLFLKNYEIPDIIDQEQKVIPNQFESALEYSKIFEYLFLNEASAQIKQELIEFLKKKEKTTKYRKVQIKIDENDYESEGSIFVMRGSQMKTDLQQKDKQQKELEVNNKSYNEDQQFCYDNIQDGICDLTTHKNFIFLISNKIQQNLRQINQLKGDNISFFGILIEPQKAQYLQQIRIQTFVNKQNFNINQWYNVFLFPFSKITTLIREYQMITKLNHKTPLASLIYNPNIHQQLIGQNIDGGWTAQFKNEIQNKELLNQFFQIVDQKYNRSQAKSIREIILKEKGICLLQGPPGTGKTHTLIGLLSGVYEYMKLTNKFPRKKILICAPSNAAIDEIIIRILQKGGLFDSEGNFRQVNLIRIGLLDEENINSELIKKVSLEDLAQHKLFSSKKINSEQDQKTTADLRIELCQIQNQIKKLEKKLNQHCLSYDEIKKIKEQMIQFNELRKIKQEYLDKTKDNKRFYKEHYNQFCEKLLNDAEIICSTLSSSGSDKLSKYLDQIELLIVDEAAQCTEPSNIIPLRLGIEKMILIGDPKQLPATTFSPISHQTLYNRSLFERILDNNFQPYFLDIQYRMHSEIRMFPSEYFYQNKLKDHESINLRTLPQKFFKNKVLFLDIIDGQEQKDGTSNINKQEAFIIIQLIKSIKQEFPTQTIGVICTYKSQVKYIKTLLNQQFQDEIFFDQTAISVNTVDSFQGQEKDIILLSCVRSSETGGIGFLNDGRRMNVALTRARNALFILGNAITLSKSNLLKSMLKNIQDRKLYRKIESQKFQFEQILTDDWNDNNKTLSKQLIVYLNQTSQRIHEKSTYNIADFQIEIIKNQNFNQNKNHQIKKQKINYQSDNSLNNDQNINCKEKKNSVSECQMSKSNNKNQNSHILQHQIITYNQENSEIYKSQFYISKKNYKKGQTDDKLQYKEHQNYRQ